MNARDVLGALQDVRGGNGQWTARCPAHEDHHPSLSITESQGKLLLYCHAGCSYEAIRRALGLSEDYDGEWAAIEATYDYRDADGNLLYQVVRLRPKSFRIRVPDLNGGWAWTLSRTKARVLYHLPEILARPDDTVYVVEGEKDADRLFRAGLLATTGIGGAGKWLPEYTRALTGRDVVILPDNDVPGLAHGQTVATALYGQARRVRVVNLPGLDEHGDVSDWLAAGHTIEELRALVEEAPDWKPVPTTSRLEGHANTFTYTMPAYGVQICIRSPKLHSDATKLTAILRIYAGNETVSGSGAINLAAARTRNALAADLEKDRPDVPWRAELTRMYEQLADQLLTGEPRLTLVSDEYPDPVTYIIPPLLPEGEPTIIYGDGASGKSLFGMLLAILVSTGIEHTALRLAAPEQRRVLYLDWERKPAEARRRLYRLGLGLGLRSPATVYYRKCQARLSDDVEAIAELIQRDKIELIVIDSLLPASGVADGRDPAGPAAELFHGIRQLDTTALVIGHHGKDRERGIYGSIFFRNLASSVWSARAYSEPGSNTLSLGLVHDKSNLSGRLPGLGIEFHFDDSDDGRGPITARYTELSSIPDAVDSLPAPQRILACLSRDAMLPREIAEETGISASTVRSALQRLASEGRVRRAGDGRYERTGRGDICPF
ncbi:MAG TPA: AAA family ATPase [Candidatus Bipolaricaulis sp.]|nr:AAA family ATPase [Candidatus Bipolaricaulis sp.]